MKHGETKVASGSRDGRIVLAHKATSFEDAERWDLEYWLSRTPAMRIEALEQLRLEWETIGHARDQRLP